jgi:hypothetical protein
MKSIKTNQHFLHQQTISHMCKHFPEWVHCQVTACMPLMDAQEISDINQINFSIKMSQDSSIKYKNVTQNLKFHVLLIYKAISK